MTSPSRPTVLVVDDEPRFIALYAEVLAPLGLNITQAETAEAALRSIEASPPELVVSDVRLPGESGIDLLVRCRERQLALPFLLVTAYADVRQAVSALKLGAVDYLAKPVDMDELKAVVQDVLGWASATPSQQPPQELLGSLVAESPSMHALLREAWLVAKGEVNVLLLGESGVGKEELARFIHRAGTRPDGPFVAVNCAALPPNLLASELFGHERGAFTGASKARRGRFREAHGGVLLLDEVGDMPASLQPSLLRAIEQRRVRPVGAEGEVAVDFRLIAATNQPLEEQVESGSFRSDLFYRLNVVSLHVPPLRDRVDDVLPLARAFLNAAGAPKRIAHTTGKLLQNYAWPGNIRELRNAMERAHLLSRSDVILPESLPLAVRQSASLDSPQRSFPTLEQTEIDSVKAALERTGGNRTRAAELLGITRRGLLKKLKRLGL